jgi:AraC-like DNA-binding protein
MKNIKSILAIVFLIYTTFSIAQENIKFVIPDSLKNISYKELVNKFYENKPNSLKSKLYAYTYLQKGKLDNSELKIAQGYHFVCFANENNPLQLIYIDSAIYIAKKMKNSDYQAMSYAMKGNYFYTKRNFKEALNNYVFGSGLAKESNIKELEYQINLSIGLLKTRLGYYDESFTIFNSCKNYYLNKNDIDNYLRSLFALADVNVRLKKYQEATIINKEGHKTAIKHKDSLMQNYFILEEGVNQYWLKNYNTSIDSIRNAFPRLKKINDNPNIAMAYHYLGMNYYKLENTEKYIDCFKKVDSVFKILNDLHPDTRRGYEILVNYYKAKGDTKNQLYYIEQLMKLDEILNTNYKYLSRKIVNEYDTPQLIAEKEKTISNLNETATTSSIKIILLFVLVAILSIVLLHFYKKQKRDRKNFEKLLLENKLGLNKNNALGNETNELIEDEINKSSSKPDIKQEIFDDILENLKKFEDDLGFLDNDCNIKDISKDFGTNSNYLSKTINYVKGVNFSLYINNLRVDYAVEKLQKDKQFKEFTIKAIAETVGFNTAESFSKAFLKRTKIQPSYFINKLKNNNLD